MNIFRTAALLFIFIFMISGCAQKKDTVLKISPGKHITFMNNRIRLDFNNNMAFTVTDVKTEFSFSTLEEKNSATDYLVIGDNKVTEFALDYDVIESKTLETNFGFGKQLKLTGSTIEDKFKIQKVLTIELYDKYPNAIIASATYENKGTTPVIINKLVSNSMILDATADHFTEQPWNFWSFQGAALEWGRDYIFPLDEKFSQKNYMGVQPETKNGGGVPVIDFWTRHSGLGVANIEPVPKLVYFPVEVTPNGKVSISMMENVDQSLKPGESISTLKTAVIIHTLDYFECLKTFSALMNDQGVVMKDWPDTAYEPIWCSWGYRSDFTAQDIYQTLPKIREMGIPWIVIDDRWFDRYGDWNVRQDLWPGGEKDMKALVDSLHNLGYKVKIWWDPPTAQPDIEPGGFPSVEPGPSDMVKNHPDWLVMNADGTCPKDERGMFIPCPSVPAVQEYFRKLTKTFIHDWGFDGHKLDAYWTVPPCYNPVHNHQKPEESHEDLPELFRIIYEETIKYKDYAVVEICNCGTPQDFWQAEWINQPVTSDPINAKQVRKRIKVFKALMGPQTPAYADHVELTNVDTSDDWQEIGQDFASAVGTGGVVGTKFTWPTTWEGLNVLLTPEKEDHWIKWISLYNKMMLSKGKYLNLYDIAFDKPETHVIQKQDRIYYAFYKDSWDGSITLKGLQKRKYRIHDYENDEDLGTVQGPQAVITSTFKDHQLIECIPID